MDAVGIRKPRDIRHDVVRTSRLEHCESRAFENLYQPFALRGVRGSQLVVIALWEVKRMRSRLLQRRSCAYGQEIMNFADRVGRSRWREHPANAPAGDALRFR